MEKVGIFFIVEPGRLEYQVEILVKSLRLYGGISDELPVYCFQPRKSGRLAKRTLQLFDEYNVVFEKVNLNKKFFFYPLANKILTGKYFEKEYGSRFDRIIFFDSDFLIQGPIELLLTLPKEIGLTPEFVSTWAIRDGAHPGPMWQIVLDQLLLQSKDFWKTTSSVHQQSILAYYNGGLICTQPKVQLFQKWMGSFEKVMSDLRILGLDHNEFYFLEMGSLAGTVVKQLDKKQVQELPLEVNFPLELAQDDLEKAAAVHYMDYFTSFGFKDLPLKTDLKEIIQEAINYKREAPRWVNFIQILAYQLFKIKLRWLLKK